MSRKRSKRYEETLRLFDRDKSYGLKEAIAILKKFPLTKFNQTVDLNFYVNVDPKKSDQLVRGTVSLPHGTGKTVRVAVFVKANRRKKPRLAERILWEVMSLLIRWPRFLDFDAAVATRI